MVRGLAHPGVPGITADPHLIARTTPGPALLRHVVHTRGVNVRPESEGRVVIEAGDVPEDAGELLRRAQGILPGLDGRAVGRADVCVRPMPADGYPIVGRTARGHYVAVTHSGFTLAAHLARLAAREIVDGEHAPELEPYRPGRFSVRPQP